MKATIKGSEILIDISDLVAHMDEECRRVFYQEVAFEEALLEACMDFLVSDYAFNEGYHTTTYGTMISRLGDRLRAKCLPLMEQAAQKQIKNLESDCKRYAEDYEKYRNYAWRLEREWPVLEHFDGSPVTAERLGELGIRRLPPRPQMQEVKP